MSADDVLFSMLFTALTVMVVLFVVGGVGLIIWSWNVRHAIQAALAQPAQEPVECLDCGSHNVGIPATYDSLVNSVKAQPEQGAKHERR